MRRSIKKYRWRKPRQCGDWVVGGQVRGTIKAAILKAMSFGHFPRYPTAEELGISRQAIELAKTLPCSGAEWVQGWLDAGLTGDEIRQGLMLNVATGTGGALSLMVEAKKQRASE